MSDRIPRIEYEDFMPELAEALRPKVERLGYCGEIWRIGANAPKSMLSFCNLTEDLKGSCRRSWWNWRRLPSRASWETFMSATSTSA